MSDREEILREIQEVISSGDFNNGKILIDEYKKNFGSSDEVESMEAIINMCNENYEMALNNIREGLKYNILNSDLYYTMGNIYEALGEYNRAYLCYEQSLYMCNDDCNKSEIINSINELKNNNKVNVNNMSFVILTYNQLEYTKVCIESIRNYCNKNTYEIIVVDNHSTDGTVEWLKMQQDIKVIYNNENKGFPKGCNQGIEIAEKDNDIMLLNNDTVLMVNSIFNLRMALYSNKNIGATGSVSNSVSNCQMIDEKFENFDGYVEFAKQNNICNEMLYEERVKLVGFAMLIKRNVLEKIGYLDERFTPGNFEDDDISLRIIMSGYKILLSKDSYIHHFGSVSFKNVKGGYNELLEKNNKKFIDKWSFSAYYAERFYKTIFKYISNDDKDILEINAGGGSNLISIRNEFKDRNYYAYEKNPKLAEMNKKLGINLVKNLDEDKYDEIFNLVILTEYNAIENQELILKIKRILNTNSRVIVVLDAYKENKDFFSNKDVEEFIEKFSKNDYKMINYDAIGEEDKITLCTILFENITKNNIINETAQILSKGKVTTAANYLTLLENENTFSDIKSVRKELENEFKILNKVKFLFRRLDVKKDENIQEVFDIIDNYKLTDDCIIGIINENMLNKNYVLNYIAIEYFAREQFDRVLPYLKVALDIDKEDNDTIYNIAYVLNCFGEKQKALKYLKNVKNRNRDIDRLIMEIEEN